MDQRDPETIGPYRILQLLGEGGMGLVYVAEQTEPIRRRVALKVIKAGMDTRQVVARFEAERQALAVMDHPNIARVLDGGETAEGRPYFVMELVKGIPLTDYCDVQKLSTRERIALFIEVCGAVQHAHQKGVIHRDLKPSNILVMLQDGVAVPKVIDFGIAKALSRNLTEMTLMTDVGQAIGTPAYMSPEQADPTALDVDTRTDIYALGVMLYELLIGRLPLDPTELGYPAFMMRLAQRETYVSIPSDRLKTMPDGGTTVSHNRRTDVRALRRELKGDLDWIVMRALEPDRTRRFQTANDLATDLHRFLNNEPISARPPSSVYRIAKFARRHRVAVGAGSVVLASMVIGISVAAVSLVRAQRAETIARQEAETARAVNALLTGLFRVSDPGEARGNSITAREILDRGASRVRAELDSQPLVQAQMLYTIGNVYRELGLFGQAQPLLEEALASRRKMLAPDDSILQGTVFEVGRLAQQQGRFAVAESLYLETLASRERSFGPESELLSPVLNALGGMLVTRGRAVEAESLLTRAVTLRSRDERPEDPDFARLLRNLGSAYLAQERYAEAEPIFRRTYAMYERVVGAEHPDAGRTLSNLGIVYYGLKRYDDAETYYQRAERNLSAALGDDHPNIASININLGEIAWRRGKLAEAESRLRRALDILAKRVDAKHPSIATAEFDLANVLRDAGRAAEAETRYRHALAIRESALGLESAGVGEVLTEYAKLLRQQRREGDAMRAESRAGRIAGRP